MPIYEYKCSACGHQEDHLQKLSEAALTLVWLAVALGSVNLRRA